ncbi:hypothetical protein BJ165DRAFT_1501840 [Panaeolus papilionaceus]|nr:hypothetical protein BJ165DRAFT_1501840 [Panaeolus papilionaceus]
MTLTLKPITDAAIKRAQASDPNSQRCLIENCSKSQAVALAHVFSRESLTHLVDGLEWSWAMKKGTLNLDTRHNIFFLSASMHELYKDKKWALLPDKDTVYRYFDEQNLIPLRRNQFPTIEGETFQYKLLPVQEMEDVYIARQAINVAGASVVVHEYPFDDLPIVTSHVHPKYVILHLGQLLSNRQIITRKALIQQIPWLKDVRSLFSRWTLVQGGAEDEPSYMPPPGKSDEHSSGTPSNLSNDDSYTPLRRIQPDTHSSTEGVHTDGNCSPFPTNGSGMTSEWCIPAKRAATRKRSVAELVDDLPGSPPKRLLTANALKRQEELDNLESVKWTSERISRWARDFRSPSPTPSPPPSQPPLLATKPPLRRSARLKAKMRRA